MYSVSPTNQMRWKNTSKVPTFLFIIKHAYLLKLMTTSMKVYGSTSILLVLYVATSYDLLDLYESLLSLFHMGQFNTKITL